MKKARAVKSAGSKKIVRDIVSVDEYGKVMSAMVENAENNLHLAEIQGKIINKMAYEFDGKGGSKVRDLTYWGLLSCAEAPKDVKKKWSPVWSKPEFQPAGDLMILTISCENPKLKHIEWGSCCFNPRDRFAERTAMTNAKRYALDKHISVVQKVAYVDWLLKNKPDAVMKLDPPKNKTEVNKALDPTFDEAKEIAIKSLYAKINEVGGYDTERVVAYFKKFYGVAHLRELNTENLRRCWATIVATKKSEEARKEFEAKL